MKILVPIFLSLWITPGCALADTYNDYVIEQASRVDNAAATIQDLFGNPRLETLAAAGDVRAQYELGMLKYSLGDNSGVQWLEKAAAQGNVRAQYTLGGVYAEGKAATRDLNRAFSMMESCSSLGNPECSFYLGMFYEEGLGEVRPNAALANWYQVEAAHYGVKRAVDHLCRGKQDCKYQLKINP